MKNKHELQNHDQKTEVRTRMETARNAFVKLKIMSCFEELRGEHQGAMCFQY